MMTAESMSSKRLVIMKKILYIFPPKAKAFGFGLE